MGNACVGPSVSKNGVLQSVSAAMWRSLVLENAVSTTNGEIIQTETPTSVKELASPVPVQDKPPGQMTMLKSEKAEPTKKQPAKPKKPRQMRRVSSAGLRVDCVLQKKTANLKEREEIRTRAVWDDISLRRESNMERMCLQIDCQEEIVRREIQIMHHLAGHPNVISIKGAYEDAIAVHVVTEYCAGGELFDRIIQRGYYTERKAAELTRIIVGVVEACHSLGVMHRDLKPENFLFVDQKEHSLLKTIDFGLSILFKPVH